MLESNETIHVCFAVHDPDGRYSKFAGVAIHSLFLNTRRKVNLHLLCDETVDKRNRENFLCLGKKFDQRISIYSLCLNDFLELSKITRCNVGTLFRLKLPSIVSLDIHKIIYIDSDVVINLDIEQLWNYSLDNNFIAAKKDELGTIWMCEVGIVEYDQYFNAGVMVLDLDRIRNEYDLWNDCVQYFNRYPKTTFADQDALNFIFHNKVKYIEKRYNLFTIPLRKNARQELMDVIYHYAGDYVHVENPSIFDKLFFSHLLSTPWGNSRYILELFLSAVQEKSDQKKAFQIAMERMVRKEGKKIIFGAQSVLQKDFFRLISLNQKHDYYIDNNIEIQTSKVHGIPVYKPDKILLEKRGSFLVIVLSKKHYTEIAKQLQSYGLEEYEDFIDGRLLTEHTEMKLR